MWIQVKMGKDVGQNLQSKSHSKNRRKWVTQLRKEGPFLKLSFDVCLCERRFFRLLSGHYSVGRTFLLPREGSAPCLIHSVVCLFLANSCLLCIHQIKSPQLFFSSAISDVPQLSAACGVFRTSGSFVFLLYDLNEMKWMKKKKRQNYLQMLNLSLCGFPFLLLSFSAFCDLYECNIRNTGNLVRCRS